MNPPLLLGIEIGGTKLQLGLGHGDGRILALERRAVAAGAEAGAIWREITGALDSVLTRLSTSRGEVQAVGIGFGGPVDAERGVVVRSHQVPGWDGWPLAESARRDLGIPTVAVHNDADTAALGEARFGAGVGLSPVLYLNSGSGVGGGLIVDGRIYRGGSGFGALEIGHLRVRPDNPGGRGRASFAASGPDQDEAMTLTLEQVASGWAISRTGARSVALPGVKGRILRELSGGDPARVTARLVVQAALRGDNIAGRILDDATTAIAQALGHAVTLLAPRRIVLGGGVSLIDESLWLDPIRSKLLGQVFEPLRGTYDVVSAALGEEIVVHGALALARDARDDCRREESGEA